MRISSTPAQVSRGVLRKLAVTAVLGLISLAPALSDIQLAFAANPSGDLRINALTAYNFVVDSNVTTPGTYAPTAGTLAAEFCNDGANDLTDVTVYVGDFKGTLLTSTPSRPPNVTTLGLVGFTTAAQ